MGRWTRPGAMVGIALAVGFAARGAGGSVHPPEGLWSEVVTGRFVVFGDDYADHLREAAARLETLRDLLADPALDWGRDGGPPATVCAFRDERTFSTHVAKMRRRKIFLGGQTRARPFSQVIFVDLEEYGAWEVLAHEGVHDAVFRRYANLPRWLHEGLAETFATLRVDGGEVTIAPHLGRLFALHSKPEISLEALFAADDPHVPVYQWGWGFVYYVTVVRPEYAAGLHRLAAALNAGRPAASAFEPAFGVPIATMEKEMDFYYAIGESPRVRLPIAPPAAPPIPPAAALDEDEVLLRLSEVMADRDSKTSALGRRYAATYLSRHPNAPRAVAAMAEIDAGREDRKAAAEEYERALAADGSDPKTLFRAAWNLVAMTLADGSFPENPPVQIPEAVARARAHLRRLLERRPSSAAALWLFGITYTFDPGDPAEGIVALERSDGIDPLGGDSLNALVGLLVRAGRKDEAERIVEERVKPLENAAALERARRQLGAPTTKP